MTVEFRDYYETLGVARGASQAEIKKAFRRLARQHHPDVKPGDASAEQRFKAINEAHEVLSDPQKRKLYDELGSQWDAYSRSGGPHAAADPFGPGGPFASRARAGGGTGPGGIRYEFRTVGAEDAEFSDFFRMFFGGGPGGGGPGGDSRSGVRSESAGGARGGQRGRTAGASLEDLLGGLGFEASGGGYGEGLRGADAGAAAGRGGATRRAPVAVAAEVTLEEAVAGTTRLLKVGDARLEVKIPKGVDTGSKVRLRGKGGHGRDLDLVVTVLKHPMFTRTGADLSRELPVTLREALLGAEVTMATLDGHVLLTVPAGTQCGRTIRLKGKGMPFLKREGRGDLYVKVRVVLPPHLSDEAKAAAQRFLELVDQPDPRAT